MIHQKFMSLTQALNLLDKEVAQGKYKFPEQSHLTNKEKQLLKAGLSVKAAITQKELQRLVLQNTQKQKYKGLCYRIPIKILTKKLTMVCYLQNLRK